jgi:beta-aspartyl-peptidase (threonine type)
VAPNYFYTDARHAQWQLALAQDRGTLLDHDAQSLLFSAPLNEKNKMGTVGAVALDAHGHLAAATSTGGMTNKRVGRVGDTPLVGAGCYANGSVAVSCTGSGEMFIRLLCGHDVAALIDYKGLTLAEACRVVVMEKLPTIEGRGGLIAVDKFGNVCLPFNTEGMYRGQARAGGPREIKIYA